MQLVQTCGCPKRTNMEITDWMHSPPHPICLPILFELDVHLHIKIRGCQGLPPSSNPLHATGHMLGYSNALQPKLSAVASTLVS